jgi:hypothetical protein
MAETNITGMAEVINSLQAMGKNIKTPKLQKVIRQSSQRIINTARSLAPVNTGDLRDSIGFITSKDSTNLDKALIGLRREYHHAYLGVMFEFGTAEPHPKKRPLIPGSLVNRLIHLCARH